MPRGPCINLKTPYPSTFSFRRREVVKCITVVKFGSYSRGKRCWLESSFGLKVSFLFGLDPGAMEFKPLPVVSLEVCPAVENTLHGGSSRFPRVGHNSPQLTLCAFKPAGAPHYVSDWCNNFFFELSNKPKGQDEKSLGYERVVRGTGFTRRQSNSASLDLLVWKRC